MKSFIFTPAGRKSAKEMHAVQEDALCCLCLSPCISFLSFCFLFHQLRLEKVVYEVNCIVCSYRRWCLKSVAILFNFISIPIISLWPKLGKNWQKLKMINKTMNLKHTQRSSEECGLISILPIYPGHVKQTC